MLIDVTNDESVHAARQAGGGGTGEPAKAGAASLIDRLQIRSERLREQ